MLNRRFMLAAAAAAALVSSPASAQVEIQWWHAMTGANNEVVVKLAEEFNASQREYRVVPTYKGSYPDTMNAGIAAFRAGNAPHILQVFEVGTATMMAARGAIKPVYQMMQEANEPFDPASYLPAVAGYYSTSRGEMLSFPFNSSSSVMWYNKDAFRRAGLNPDQPPRTWPEVFEAAKKLRAAGYDKCGFSSAWITWLNIEQFSLWHNVPLATRANGIDGFDTELRFNSPLHVRHLQNLIDLQRDNTFSYSGRTNTGEGRFTSGECPIMLTSSGFYGNVRANAKFEWGNAPMPYYPDVQGAPQNSTLGGASLWVMGGKPAAEYRGVARFFTFLSDVNRQAKLHTDSGYIPITRAAYAQVKASGFYTQNPYLETPLLELTNKPPTENSRGIRLGNMVQLRDVWAEEVEAALAGQKPAQAALDAAVARGNTMLRQFERTVSR
ncbi:sn-glycerol-3-phosphate ABC transporter substrate-binding protein UgpB [Phreatobacter sp. AB_2022a]|uniref:sn-glycerol-3-phosphate ABC transporter substrate-binding protein UgpB n=1 Tax=Phreatobacter sp. AB_2022a TaxID=3003134 RepID=UPI00056E7A92|nr:sn-glycerol-3-phosphate ABC transporter substrate-binding protein UgpB [Phreatobacter sp. AB_2022a]MCZ0736863.1 sn-glycerol-3-phosphate ABC transporter substrate-binding protein UgpB [Phreatobacter sp. AB_2022a]CEJ15860.1 sn-glycerol-3-phosphate-binding periplasmic protein UgpB precursor [bacterium YEK0313]